MKIDTLYGVVLRFPDGGVNMNSFMNKNSALAEASKLINQINISNKKGLRVFLSELEYDEYRNKILSDSLINDDSQLLFEN